MFSEDNVVNSKSNKNTIYNTHITNNKLI